MDEEDWDAEITSNTVPVYRPAPTTTASYRDKEAPKFSFGRGRPFDKDSAGNDRFGSYQNTDQSRFGRQENQASFSSRNYENRSGFSRNYKDSNDSRSSYNRSNNYEKVSNSGGFYDNNNNQDDSLTELYNIESRLLSSVIGKGGSTINNIRDTCHVKVHVPSREEAQNVSNIDVRITGRSQSDIDRAKNMIKDTIGKSSSYGHPRLNDSNNKRQHSEENFQDNNWGFSGEQKKPFFDTKSNDLETKIGPIDWDTIRAQPLQNLSKFKDHPEVLKDFYVEDPEITAMSREEVKQFRKENFNIIVELFKKENLSYSLTKKPEEDKRTPEEIEDYLFKMIPKPVKTIENCFSRFPDLMAECKRQNFLKPTPIQSQLWPILLKGLDCVGIAQTGTGKTLAFLLPALIHIDNQITPPGQRLGPNVLVLSPTRELAIQIEQEVKKINYKGIKSLCVYGGGDRKEQVNSYERGCGIIIATPGRLYDLISAGIINVTSVTYLVLDEADRMLDLGFEPQIMKILLDIRPDRQTVMTSATWPEGVRRLATKYLNEPIQLYVGSLDLSAAKTVTQHLIMVQSEEEKKDILMDYIENKMSPTDKLIVFVGRKSLADNLSCDLCMKQISVESIHGDREQCDREEALQDFKAGHVRILIATDVASRGIDVKDITCVINYDFPRNIEDYVHRVGRTGRAGMTGTAMTYMTRQDWKHAKELIEILNKSEQEVPESLIEMSKRYDAMLKKREEEGGSRGGRGGGYGGGGFGGGGFGGGGFGGGGFGASGNREGGRNNSGFGGRSFEPRGNSRGGRGSRGGRRDDSGGFVLF